MNGILTLSSWECYQSGRSYDRFPVAAHYFES